MISQRANLALKLEFKDRIFKEKIYLSKPCEQIVQTLNDCGFEAWAVGGCVRDSIMGKVPYDFDVTTNASPNDVKEIFEGRGHKTIDTGIKHGTVSVIIKDLENKQEVVEVTTYRSDGKYRDSRHPDEVTFVDSLDEDLKRRDFTINAIAYNPKIGIYDPHFGLDDIKNKTIKCVGSPKKRFVEDALRILRACRFVSTTGFDLDEKCFDAACASKSKLIMVSSERITNELDKLLAGEYVFKSLMQCVDLLEVVIPEISASKGFDQQTKYHAFDVWEHISHVVEHVDNEQLLRWAALCHDIGKPSMFFKDESGQGHFYGHAAQSKRLSENMLSRLTLKNSLKKDILTLVERHNDTLSPTKKSIISTIKLMNGDVNLFRKLLELKRADSLGHAHEYVDQVKIYDEIESLLDEMLTLGIVFKTSDLKINGKDMIDLGIKEGPKIKEKLEVALQWVQSEVCKNNREELLLKMKKNLSQK